LCALASGVEASSSMAVAKLAAVASRLLLRREITIGSPHRRWPTAGLDHLVGQQRFRDGEAERLGGLEVDDELELASGPARAQ
jgi:hypothetical protein